MRLPAQLRKRKNNSHKGDYGRVLVVAGSKGMTGAARLAGLAALRSGAGLVTVAIPSSLKSMILRLNPELMWLDLDDRLRSVLKKALPKFNAVVIGPGLSTKPSIVKLIFWLIKNVTAPIVIDADAINALSLRKDLIKSIRSVQPVLTPHSGEFSRLLGVSVKKVEKNRKELVKEFSLRYNLTLVLKGYHTLVSHQGKIFENSTGNPGMATAGSGDVLSGIIAGFLAQGIDGFSAAKLGVYLHGLAGDIAAKEKTQISLIASDIIECLPKAFKKIS